MEKKKKGNPNWYKGMPSANPAGKPVGAKDKSWSTLQYWMDKMEASWDQLEPEAKVKYSIEVVKLLAPRRTLPPETPEDSKKNVDMLWEEIKREEGNGGPQPSSSSNVLGDGKAEIQASAATEESLRCDKGVAS